MPKKHITPKQKAQIATLRAAGYSITAIAEKVGVSVSTVKRYATKIPKGAANEELIDQARQDLLTHLADDNIKSHLASLIADDLALSDRLRARVASVLEETDAMVATTPQEAGQLARMLSAAATAIKLSSDTLRTTLGVTERQLHTSTTENLPELTIVDLTGQQIQEIRDKAAAISAGVGNGLGGVLSDADENDTIIEGADEPEMV